MAIQQRAVAQTAEDVRVIQRAERFRFVLEAFDEGGVGCVRELERHRGAVGQPERLPHMPKATGAEQRADLIPGHFRSGRLPGSFNPDRRECGKVEPPRPRAGRW